MSTVSTRLNILLMDKNLSISIKCFIPKVKKIMFGFIPKYHLRHHLTPENNNK